MSSFPISVKPSSSSSKIIVVAHSSKLVVVLIPNKLTEGLNIV